MQKYKCVFFDLDHTLWDFDHNSKETLTEIFEIHQLQKQGVDHHNEFIRHYKEINGIMWDQFHKGEIDRKELRYGRFEKTLLRFEIDDKDLVFNVVESYLEILPEKKKLFPYTFEILDYLKTDYPLALITNGFEAVQHKKLRNTNLHHYFDEIITSERAGYQKPHKNIFSFALELFNLQPHEAVMIGDNWNADIMGAVDIGMDAIYFNPHRDSFGRTGEDAEKVSFFINCLSQLKTVL